MMKKISFLRRSCFVMLLLTAACDGSAVISPDLSGGQLQPPTPARLVLSPAFQVVDAGESAQFSARISALDGAEIAASEIVWTSSDTTVVAVDASGRVQARGAGVARVTANSGAVRDSAIITVAEADDVLLTALANGTANSVVKPDQAISVPVTLDLSRVSSDGDLGSLQFDVLYDANLLVHQSATVNISGAAMVNEVEPGRIRFVFAATENQGMGVFTLLTLNFKVSSSAVSGARGALSVQYDVAPTNSHLDPYGIPVTVGTAFRVAS
jgi:hypothetical protein